jgi:GNAT superfamily N-acetyltransferase
MTMKDGYHAIAPGKLAAIVTFLEMNTRPDLSQHVTIPGCEVARVYQPGLAWYRTLFERVGAPWLWSSRLKLDDQALAAILHDPAVEVFALSSKGRDEGYVELDFRKASECELAYFGVTVSQIGTGSARLLMQTALRQAWQRPMRRAWVHTCTLDHPNAVAFYQRAGFKPYARKLELFDDPRLTGHLDRDCAPTVPLL